MTSRAVKGDIRLLKLLRTYGFNKKAAREQSPPKHVVHTNYVPPNGCDKLAVTRRVVYGFNMLVLLSHITSSYVNNGRNGFLSYERILDKELTSNMTVTGLKFPAILRL